MKSTWKLIKLRAETVDALAKFVRDLHAEAEDGGYVMAGEQRDARGRLIRKDGITRDDAVQELLRRVKAHRRRAKKARRKPRPTTNGTPADPRITTAATLPRSVAPTIFSPLA